jgi:hypothetical protein
MDIYYVYAYVRKNGTPYYIGKGKNDRAYKRHSVSVPKDKSKIVFIFEELSEQDALDLECLLIKYHGRKDNNTGILYNKTDGGEGSSGRKHLPESIQKMRNAKKDVSYKTRIAISNAKKNKPAHNKGKSITEETRAKLVAAWERRRNKESIIYLLV